MTASEEHRNALAFHPLQPGREELHRQVREGAIALAGIFDGILPPSREASLAFTALQEAAMWANAALAIHWTSPGPLGIQRHEDADPLVPEP